MTHDDPATRLANALAECFDVVVHLASEPAWRQFCERTEALKRKTVIVEVLSDLLDAATLLELPEVHGPKDVIRPVIPIAAELSRSVATWDGESDPSATMTSLARDFLKHFGSGG